MVFSRSRAVGSTALAEMQDHWRLSSLEPSYVLRALGVGDDLAHSSIRFGMGRFTTVEEVDYAAEKMIAAVKRLREMSPLYEMVKDGVDLSTVQWTSH